MMSPTITIAITVIRAEAVLELLKSMCQYITDEQIVIIVDGRKFISDEQLEKISHYPVELIINDNNLGISVCRNIVLDYAKNDYLVFFDDEVKLVSNILPEYKNMFVSGKNIVGGPARIPRSYPPIPKWLPDALSSLLGVHTIEKKIWGANFGFNRKMALEYNTRFNIKLGRTDGKLISGDETTFIKELCEKTNEVGYFNENLEVEHFIDLNRYKLKYSVRRIYWQGRSEVRRHAVVKGLSKEFKRSFFGYRGSIVYFPAKMLAGIILYTAFLVGIVNEGLQIRSE